jgi:hypothetical protein
LAAQGDESDADGTVDAFIVQAVTSGTLKIGTSAASATAFAVGSNDRIDAIRNAYWTPAANVSGNAMAAFSVLLRITLVIIPTFLSQQVSRSLQWPIGRA